jgi:hypothetical protein
MNADVFDNVSTHNAGGILVFDLPGLPQMGGHSTRVFRNKVIDNDTPNFAPKGNIVAQVPTSTGVMLMANRNVHVFENEISGNATSADEGVATSGAASASAVMSGSQALQFLAQIQGDFGAGTDIADNENTSDQAASNDIQNDQQAAAQSGAADASDAGQSTTGAATSALSNTQNQAQSLLAQIQSAFQAAAAEEPAP